MNATAAAPPAPGRNRGEFHILTVARVERLCDDAVAVTFDVPADRVNQFQFRPGQSITVRRRLNGREERRSYSVCSPIGAPLRIGVREVVDGAISGWLVHDVVPGDRIEVQPPTGSFSPEPGTSGRHVLIAAGSGITPILSITSSLLARPGTQATLIYGNRRTGSVMFADDVADLKDQYPARFQLIHVLSREPHEVDLFTGRIDADKLRDLLPAVCQVGNVDHWWLCGPFGMVADAVEVLEAFGVPPTRVHRELFYVEELPPEPHLHPDPVSSGNSNVTVILDGRASSTTIAADTSVLEGAQRIRGDLPFACKGGVCGTCRAKLTRGEVHMRRNFALDPSEIDAGFVLTCQSVPVSGDIVIDFDA